MKIEETGVKIKGKEFEELQKFVLINIGTQAAHNACHEAALKAGLPEICGMYGISLEGEFVKLAKTTEDEK